MRLLLLLALLLSPAFAQARLLFSEPVSLATPSGQLSGTLLVPHSKAPVPVALLVAGSGPTDRDGNNPLAHTDNLRKLAVALAEMGVASLRYDKRGVGRSLDAGRDERSLSLERYVEDLRAWSEQLRRDPRLGRQILVGHSEGALVASLAAPRTEAAALISIAGSGRPIARLLRQQLQGKLPPALLAHAGYLIDELEAGRIHPVVPDELMVLLRPSVQPYLVSLFRQDPAEAFAQVQVPALIVQGSRDVQVGLDDARALHRARPQAELAVIDGMNHVLRIVGPASDDPLTSYNQPELPLAPVLLRHIEAFLQRNGLLPASS